MDFCSFLTENTPAGVLGTVGAWHHRAPRYSLRRLETVVRGFAPDLLCAEINRTDWEAERPVNFSPEYRECLVPLCRELSITVVPVGDRWRGLPSPLRLALLLGASPGWINSPPADRWHRAWAHLRPRLNQANQELVAHVLETVQRDPGRRVLVTVRVERHYAVVGGLSRSEKVTLLSAWTSTTQSTHPG